MSFKNYITSNNSFDGFQTEFRGSRTPKKRRSHKTNNSEQYAGNVLQFFPTSEGYVKATRLDKSQTEFSFNYIYNHTDHLGNVRVSYTLDPQTGKLRIVDEHHYYPFGLRHEVHYPSGNRLDFYPSSTQIGDPVQLINVTKTEYMYRYNSKEWQDELGLNMYAMDMRMYDPAIARWVVIDPVTHHSQSTYMGFDGNPVFWSDPSGASVTVYTGQAAIDFFISERDRIDDEIKRKQQDNDDDITVNSSGIITEIARNNRPNRFFDENGNEIFLNDAKNVDEEMLTKRFNVGNRLYYPISEGQVLSTIKSVSSNNSIIMHLTLARKLMSINYKVAMMHYYKAMSQIADASWGEADFTFSYLQHQLEFVQEDGRLRTHLTENQAYFRFGNRGEMYNLYDGGNFMWGAWTKILTLTNLEVWLGSNLNEVFQGRMGDEKADQDAIWSGRKFIK